MRKFMHVNFSPRKIRFFSTFLVSIVTMTVVLLLTNCIMNRSLENAEKQYIKTCEGVLEGYSNAIYYYLENYHTSLSSMYNRELFLTNDIKEIHKWIKKTVPFSHKDLCVTYYVTKEGMAYFSNGLIHDISGTSYYEYAKQNKIEYLISDIYKSKYTNELVIIIALPVYQGDNFEGMLCAGIVLDIFQKITEEIKIGNNSSAYLIDKSGKFIASSNKSMIGKKFKPSDNDYKNISSDFIALSKNGYVETVSSTGEEINLFLKKIPVCGWTLTVGFTKAELNRIYKQQYKVRISVIIVSLVAILILLFLEMKISESFYKRQLISFSYDSLTKLWTRQKFEYEAKKLLKRYPDSVFMFIETDIRGFKFINQNYGSQVADNLISSFSTQINTLAMERHGLIGRGYADRFYMLFRVKNVRSAMSDFNNKIYDLMERCKNSDIPFFPKFGITFIKPKNHKYWSIKELVSQAGFAKNTIKNNMLSPYAVYNMRMVKNAREINFIESSMEKALANEEFFVVYQPKISLADDKVVGAEALVRWKNPDKGIIGPNQFIEVFEKNNFIQKLDFYVYDKVFNFIDRQLKAGKKIVPISVNMSRNHNKPEKFVQEFTKIFNKYDIPSSLVQVEIIERSVMDKYALQAITVLLHDNGFTVAMDDFGTGESSLSMLTKVPVDVLKFDREFLLSSTKENGDMDEDSANFISILINLSKVLKKETIFEGVETESQRDFLKSIKCDQVQGFFYSKPLSEEDFVEFLKNH